ncbi:hypothetical protein [Paraburkholderia bannensis]|uniref:hypothetical protein n=1 Tax=Paraburkholderia bannensis TaxID=765414 RepID=UPI0012EC5FC7|nr:hypothetical protein [Paraburkholderia bannensis]
MKKVTKLVTALAISTCAFSSSAFTPTIYSKGISIRFDEGKFSLSDHEKSRLAKLIVNLDDFVSLNVFLVIAHGDVVSGDENQDFQTMLAGARANAINSFYAERASPQFHALIHTFTEPIKAGSQVDEVGRAEVVVEGFCKPGNDVVCKEHWPPSQIIERE